MKKILIIVLIISWGSYAQETAASFKPQAGKYLISAWVKEKHAIQPLTYTSKIKIVADSNVIEESIHSPSGQIIDGWQRIVGIIEIKEFNVAFVKPKLTIELICSENQSVEDCYFDDIRFFPYDGNLKSFVYNEENQRLMAELDENNFATFYEYDLEGGLVRVKKETERGVFTIQETRSNNTKK